MALSVVRRSSAPRAKDWAAPLRSQRNSRDDRRVREVSGDLNDSATRAALIAACPDADILVNNNCGPPFKTFEAIMRDDILAGVEFEHADADCARPGASAWHGAAEVRSHRQHYLGLGAGADSRARRLVGSARRSDGLSRFCGPGTSATTSRSIRSCLEPSTPTGSGPHGNAPPPSAGYRSRRRAPGRKPAARLAVLAILRTWRPLCLSR